MLSGMSSSTDSKKKKEEEDKKRNKEGTTGNLRNGLHVIKASYGITGNSQDVTNEVESMSSANNGSLNFTVSPQSFGILDPAPGVSKTFQLQTIINGGEPSLTTYNDGDIVQVSAPPVPTDTKKAGTAVSAISTLWSAFSWFMFSLFGFFFFQSSYTVGIALTRSATRPAGIQVVGWILGFMSLLTMGWFGMIGLPLSLLVVRLFRTTDIPLYS
jgi:hypothetical protein